MPKTKLDLDLRLYHLIRRYMYAENIQIPALAKRMNLSSGTVYSRFKKTDSFSVKELKQIQKIVHIPIDELREALL